MDEISKRIAEAFKESGLTNLKIAEKLNVSPAFISLISSGKRSPSERTIMQIAKELRFSESWLLTGDGEMRPKYTRNESIMIGINDILADEDDSFRKRWIDVLSNLSAEQWQVLKDISDQLLDKTKSSD